MKTMAKVGEVEVDALDLGALYKAYEPIIQRRIAEKSEEESASDALQYVTTLAFSVQSMIGALLFQRSEIGVFDGALQLLYDELQVALGLAKAPERPAGSGIVVAK